MKRILEESGLISLMTAFVLSLLQPFGLEQMPERRMTFIFTVSLFTLGVAVLSYSVVRALTRRDGGKLSDIALFHLVNIPLLSAVLLTSISWFNWGNLHTAWYCTQGHFSVLNYLIVCCQVSLVSVFIFFMQLYRSKNRRLQQENETLRVINAQLEEHLDAPVEETPCPETEGETPAAPPSVITLLGNANNATLKVNIEQIIYIESVGNYAKFCLMCGGQIQSQMLRITMKQLREVLDVYPRLFSCHRAFMVNMDYIQSVSGCHSAGYQLQLFGTDKQIPVSRSNSDEFEQRMGVSQ